MSSLPPSSVSSPPAITSASSSDPSVLRLLQGHPSIGSATPGEKLLEFHQDDRTREVLQGAFHEPVYGLVELMDNNPMVCADRVSIPSAAASLVLIAAGPILLAGLISRAPLLFLNFPSPGEELLASLKALAPIDSIRVMTPNEDPSVAATVSTGVFGKGAPVDGMMALQLSLEVPSTVGLPEMTSIFAERFGRSFYVRERKGTGHIRVADELVGKPSALYTIEVARGGTTNQVLIEVSADPAGKPGAAGLIHAMNIMAGLEESLGIPG